MCPIYLNKGCHDVLQCSTRHHYCFQYPIYPPPPQIDVKYLKNLYKTSQ